ncbi:hypothetical protein [Sporisorium scitamineum]|uniref:Uncharacterized protein n=1 Tax=Sporisorium scitamineum TaxID=49012 RepID=A0A0F7RXU9_9BASI|nr:hypothetical protein [Sporisorium scitamineum]
MHPPCSTAAASSAAATRVEGASVLRGAKARGLKFLNSIADALNTVIEGTSNGTDGGHQLQNTRISAKARSG